MNEEQFKERYKYRNWEWPHVGDKVKFLSAEGMFYPHFTDVIDFAKKNLSCGREYSQLRSL